MSTENKHNHFTFNGESSLDFGLVISRVQSMRSQGKRIESIEIPGRSGALHQWDGSYEEYDQVYKCWFLPETITDSLSARVHLINEWLSSAPAGAELRDSYDELTYRRATYIGGAEIKTVGKECGVFDIKFRCDPRCFIESGRDFRLEVGSPVAALNPGIHYSKPLITVTCAESGVITFRARQGETIRKTYEIHIDFPDTMPHTVTIDCELGEAWGPVNGVIQSLNKWISVEEFPELWPGQNDIEVSGGITAATVDARWWTL